jgi:tetratricopeptide (TPR) repeat protein
MHSNEKGLAHESCQEPGQESGRSTVVSPKGQFEECWPRGYMSMTFFPRLVFAVGIFLLVDCGLIAQSPQSGEKLAEQAQREFLAGRFRDAELDFRGLTKLNPSDIVAQLYLGHSLFRQEKYTEAGEAYEKARDLEKTGNKLSLDQHRILTDQLAMAYGISGNLKKSRALLEEAVQQDPEYPLNYYNLACLFAEMGDKSKMFTNLSLAFQHKAHILKGEQMPDPRSDSSFQKYIHDQDFIALMRDLGYK